MLMRRLYQGLGLVLLAFAAFTFVMAIIRLFAGGGIGALVLGVTLAAVVGALGFIVYAFATGPAQRGLHYFGVVQKAEIERSKSLERKPQAPPRSAAK